MTERFASHKPATAFDHDSTLVAAMELSGKSWELGALVPGVARRPRRRVKVGDVGEVLAAIERWKGEAAKAGRAIVRVALAYEAGRDGFWIARYLIERGIEAHVMQPASIAVERRGRRAKTDRIDLDMLLRTLLAWLRGEPRVCSMVRVPSIEEEDSRRPGRERDHLVRERVAIENRITSLLSLHGIAGFKPRLKKAVERLERLRTAAGSPPPPRTMEELRRLMGRQRLLGEQIKQIEAARDAAARAPNPNREERMIQFLIAIAGLGVETATLLVCEVLCRPFRDRGAIACFVGLTGTPFQSGGMEREQGIAKTGNQHVRCILVQLAWRWLRFQPDSALSRWFVARVAGGKGRIRKIMIVALARKLLVALWRYVQTGLAPEGVALAAA